MNIVLIGYRGTGKSAVGKIIGERLQMRCVSMDEKIVENAGLSIPKIVDKYGWPKFRDMETEVAQALAGQDNLIIDTGGGVIERPENMKALQENAIVVWLKASADTIVSRIEGGTQRPALVDGKTFTEEVAEVLEQRTPKYSGAARYEIDTDHLTPERIADRVIEIWNHNDNR